MRESSLDNLNALKKGGLTRERLDGKKSSTIFSFFVIRITLFLLRTGPAEYDDPNLDTSKLSPRSRRKYRERQIEIEEEKQMKALQEKRKERERQVR